MSIKQANEDRYIQKMNRQNEMNDKLLRFKENNRLQREESLSRKIYHNEETLFMRRQLKNNIR
jgi:hypothetical protein